MDKGLSGQSGTRGLGASSAGLCAVMWPVRWAADASVIVPQGREEDAVRLSPA